MPEQIGYAVCLDNEGYEASLELRKLYPVIIPEANDPAGYIRIIDESGEDYLYVASAFETITLPPHIARRLATTYS
ncbi:MAG: hypothetical protein QOC96_1151 [Acidobacteriota bacterium]|jgi:hypothetical protein|nr:hypothetical protein [Acidobacteriota bacterium]